MGKPPYGYRCDPEDKDCLLYTSDVIDFVARAFDLSSYEAAQKLAADFGLDPKPPTAAATFLFNMYTNHDALTVPNNSG